VKNKILIALFATCLLSSQARALLQLSLGECRTISLIFLGVAAVGLGTGIPLLTVETDALGYHNCPSEIQVCTSTCIYKTCANCTNVPVLTRCSAGNETIYSATCDPNSILGCVRNDTLAEVGKVFVRNDGVRGVGIAFVVVGAISTIIGLLALANVEAGAKWANQPGYQH